MSAATGLFLTPGAGSGRDHPTLLALEDAMKLADNPEELKMELRGIVKGARATDFDFNF